MEWLTALYPAVRTTLFDAIPDFWPDLNLFFARYVDDPIMAEIILPLAACRAVGGRADHAVPAAAALASAVASVRTVDDLLDRDRPGQLWEQVGPARAWNYAIGAKHLSYQILHDSPLPPFVVHRISQVFTRAFLRIASGQDLLLAGINTSFDDYWHTMELRSANAYSAACAAGALVGTENLALVDSCARFGQHLGLVMQVFNDIEAIWTPKPGELFDSGIPSLPIVFGLASPHHAGEQIRTLFSEPTLSAELHTVRELLDELNTRDFLIQIALRERQYALDALSMCPNTDGKDALEGYITGLFGDLDQLRQAS